DHVEFSLLLGGGGSATGGRSRGDGDRSRGGNTPLLLEHLRELGSLEDREGRKVVYEFGEICHLIVPQLLSFSSNRGFRLRRHCPCPRMRPARGRPARLAPAGPMRSAPRAA